MAELPPKDSPTENSPSVPSRGVIARLIYDFYPPRYIQGAFPQFGINELALKGLLTNLTYLSHKDVWFAKAAIAPAEVHPQIKALVGGVKNMHEMGLRTPSQCSHDFIEVFSTVDFDSGHVRSIQAVEGVRAGTTDEQRQLTLGVASALGRSLASASLEAAYRYASGEFDASAEVVHRLSITGIADLPPDTHRMTTSYTYTAD